MTVRNIAIAFGFLLLAAMVLDQRPQPAEKATSSAKVFAPVELGEHPGDAAVRDALDRHIDLKLQRVPLHAAMDQLQSLLGIEIVVLEEVLDFEGIKSDVPLTIDVKDVPVRNALMRMFEPYELGWYVDEGVLKIVTDIFLYETVSIRLYDVADLVGGRFPQAKSAYRFRPLIDLLTETVAPDMWEMVGGPGTISEYETEGTGVLVIRQSPPVHEKIERLLAALRQMRHEGTPQVSRVRPVELVENTRIQDAARSGKLPRYLDDDPQRDAVAAAVNDLAFKLYPQLASDQNTNLVFSPVSVSAALSLAYAGAEGETAEELRRVLHVSGDETAWNAGMGELLRTLPRDVGGDVELRLANQLFVQQDYPVQQPFLDVSRETYGAKPVPVNFRNVTAARRTINDWVAEQTHGKLSAVVPSGLLTPEARLVTASLVSLKAPWETPFVPNRTRSRVFHAPQRDIEVNMMSEAVYTKFADLEELQVLALNYADPALSMWFVLEKQPTDGKWLKGLEDSLSNNQLNSWQAACKEQLVHVEIPRFAFQTSANLQSSLEHLGVRRIFSQQEADLRRMSTERPFWMEFILHQARIDVDEEGTEAAAATMVGYFGGGDPQHPTFRADHPFLFLIRDNRTGAILFLGRVMTATSAG